MSDPLIPSTQDDVMLAEAVRVRFGELCEAYLRMRKVRLSIPEDVKPDATLYRRMWWRHSKGDARHTESEMQATKAFAAWTHVINCSLRGQPFSTIQWKEDLGIV